MNIKIFNLLRFTIDDPSGNSYIKNPNVPSKDLKLREVKYYRTRE